MRKVHYVCYGTQGEWRIDMARVGIITGETGGLGMEFTCVIDSYDDIDEIWAVGSNHR